MNKPKTLFLALLTSLISLIIPLANAASLPAVIKGNDGAEMVLIPAGNFVMGSNKVDKSKRAEEFGSIKPWYMDEHPQHIVSLPSFYMDKYEVTNQQFREFVKQTSYRPPSHWLENGYLVSMKREKLNAIPTKRLQYIVAEIFRIDIDTRKMNKQQLLSTIDEYFAMLDNVPVYNVNWAAARDYCDWAGQTLPTEEQWEKATRGPSGQEFPWGDTFQDGMSNTGEEEWVAGAAPVGSYATDHSPYGIYDVAGNVSEWVMDWYDAYPNSDYTSKLFGKRFKVIRGAGWGGNGHYALQMYQRGAYRLFVTPDAEKEDLGFRCVQTSPQGVRKNIAHN